MRLDTQCEKSQAPRGDRRWRQRALGDRQVWVVLARAGRGPANSWITNRSSESTLRSGSGLGPKISWPRYRCVRRSRFCFQHPCRPVLCAMNHEEHDGRDSRRCTPSPRRRHPCRDSPRRQRRCAQRTNVDAGQRHSRRRYGRLPVADSPEDDTKAHLSHRKRTTAHPLDQVGRTYRCTGRQRPTLRACSRVACGRSERLARDRRSCTAHFARSIIGLPVLLTAARHKQPREGCGDDRDTDCLGSC